MKSTSMGIRRYWRSSYENAAKLAPVFNFQRAASKISSPLIAAHPPGKCRTWQESFRQPMPRDRKTPQEQAKQDAANARIRWLSDFNDALVKLRPHLEGASKWLNTVGVAELARAGIESDPVAVARAYHEASKKKV